MRAALNSPPRESSAAANQRGSATRAVGRLRDRGVSAVRGGRSGGVFGTFTHSDCLPPYLTNLTDPAPALPLDLLLHLHLSFQPHPYFFLFLPFTMAQDRAP